MHAKACCNATTARLFDEEVCTTGALLEAPASEPLVREDAIERVENSMHCVKMSLGGVGGVWHDAMVGWGEGPENHKCFCIQPRKCRNIPIKKDAMCTHFVQ